MVGQLATILFVHQVMQIRLPLAPLATLVAIEAASNLIGALWLRRGGGVREWHLAATLACDVMILTGLLFFTGGPFNPFSFLFLVHIALATIVLRAGWTWALVGLSLACSGALFYGHRWLPLEPEGAGRHADHMRIHLQGMWVAFGVAAGFIVYFVTRIRRALARREEDLAVQRGVAVRNEKLVSLATLAAGAAHELATPLGTIAVVTREIERLAEQGRPCPLDDIRLIKSQVERCRGILMQMATDAGESTGESFTTLRLDGLLAEAVEGLPPTPPIALALGAAADASIEGPPRALAQALRVAIRNAQDASPPEGPVTIAARALDGAVEVEVLDHGPGMPPEVLARVGEPFFTTKAPGKGMGLGLFLARSLVERVGGELRISSSAGAGTRVVLRLPQAPRERAPSGALATAPAPLPAGGAP